MERYERKFTKENKSLIEKVEEKKPSLRNIKRIEEKIEDSFEVTPLKKPSKYLEKSSDSQILLLNEILQRVIDLDNKFKSINKATKPVEIQQENQKNKEIVVLRDEAGRITGAKIVEDNDIKNEQGE